MELIFNTADWRPYHRFAHPTAEGAMTQKSNDKDFLIGIIKKYYFIRTGSKLKKLELIEPLFHDRVKHRHATSKSIDTDALKSHQS